MLSISIESNDLLLLSPKSQATADKLPSKYPCFSKKIYYIAYLSIFVYQVSTFLSNSDRKIEECLSAQILKMPKNFIMIFLNKTLESNNNFEDENGVLLYSPGTHYFFILFYN